VPHTAAGAGPLQVAGSILVLFVIPRPRAHSPRTRPSASPELPCGDLRLATAKATLSME
jgi:hypothetical protein